MGLSLQQLEPYQHPSPPVASSALGNRKTMPRPSEAIPELNFVSRSPDDSSSSADDGEWPELVSRTCDWVSSVQESKRSIAALSGSYTGYCLPPRFIPNPHISGTTVRFIMSQYEPLFELVFFKPARARVELMRGKFVSWIISSSITHWSMYLGARIYQTLRQDGDHANIHNYIPWLDRFDRLCATSNNDVSLDDLTGRLSGALELMVLKYITSNANSGYAFMRRMAPTFMQIAFADPSLWPRHPSSSGISLAHLLVSPRYELGRFAFADTISSLTYGTPPLVEYDTTHPVIRASQEHPSEWVRGCPAEFIFSIVKISAWRAQRPHAWAEPGMVWKEIEDATRAWRSRCDYGPERDSWKTVARFATQEGWRHAVLIYLYLGMCGVTSHDPRVQNSVRQISRLQSVMKSDIAVGIHFFIPLLLAAICTRSEAERGRFHAAISQSGDNKACLQKGVEFASVLDHLWHGAAANGAPITWDDYVNSRKAVVHIDV